MFTLGLPWNLGDAAVSRVMKNYWAPSGRSLIDTAFPVITGRIDQQRDTTTGTRDEEAKDLESAVASQSA